MNHHGKTDISDGNSPAFYKLEQRETMLNLLKKAAYIYLIVFLVYAVSYGIGYLSGSKGWVNCGEIMQSPVIKFSIGLESKVPGYGDLLKSYKERHNKLRNRYLMERNVWGMRRLIFFNNWIVANFTMTVRSIFILPICLSVPGKFYQGVVISQAPGASGTLLFMESIYFLTVCATLCLVFWTLFYRLFKFKKRRTAFVGGLKLLGAVFIASAIGMAIGSWIETDMILGMFSAG
jgi:hypothetical protein